MTLTVADGDRAREVFRARWPRDEGLRLQRLPRREQTLIVELVALLDAEPVDPVTGEPLIELDVRTRERARRFAPLRSGNTGPLPGPPPGWHDLGRRLGVEERTTKGAA